MYVFNPQWSLSWPKPLKQMSEVEDKYIFIAYNVYMYCRERGGAVEKRLRVDVSFNDDVTVILFLGISFMSNTKHPFLSPFVLISHFLMYFISPVSWNIKCTLYVVRASIGFLV